MTRRGCWLSSSAKTSNKLATAKGIHHHSKLLPDVRAFPCTEIMHSSLMISVAGSVMLAYQFSWYMKATLASKTLGSACPFTKAPTLQSKL